ncbi:MAG: hypothetical protein ACR2JU_05045 [Nocardioidaceae bacterium]
MRSDILQTGMVLNPVSEPPPQRTYVTFGTRRGGTSPVAGIIRALGVDLGRIGKRTNNEDPDFQNRPSPHMRQAIARRNDEYDVWGWKFPGAGTYLPEIAAAIRNPFYVVVFRDPVAAALSQARLDREVNRRQPPVALHESNANTNTNTGFVLASGRPCLLVSNEKAREQPDVLVDEVADYLFAERPSPDMKSRILDYMTPGKYKAFEDYFDRATDDAASR